MVAFKHVEIRPWPHGLVIDTRENEDNNFTAGSLVREETKQFSDEIW